MTKKPPSDESQAAPLKVEESQRWIQNHLLTMPDAWKVFCGPETTDISEATSASSSRIWSSF